MFKAIAHENGITIGSNGSFFEFYPGHHVIIQEADGTVTIKARDDLLGTPLVDHILATAFTDSAGTQVFSSRDALVFALEGITNKLEVDISDAVIGLNLSGAASAQNSNLALVLLPEGEFQIDLNAHTEGYADNSYSVVLTVYASAKASGFNSLAPEIKKLITVSMVGNELVHGTAVFSLDSATHSSLGTQTDLGGAVTAINHQASHVDHASELHQVWVNMTYSNALGCDVHINNLTIKEL